MQNNYFILRHGETIYQTRKREMVYPWPETTPVKLTKKGEEQIKKAAKLLKAKGIDVIYSSDVFRTRQTAKIVAKTLGTKVTLDLRLRDTNLGIYHGRKKEEFYRDFPINAKITNTKMIFSQRPKGGENWNNVKRRMKNFVREIDKKHKNKNILIISHGDPLWLLEGAMKGFNNQEFISKVFVKKNFIRPGEVRKL